MNRCVVIAGAGPAGLTAALELLRRSELRPILFEADSQVGGISKTINYRGNRMDLGGHRFFSKSDWVMNWWQEILPGRGHARGAAGPATLPTRARVASSRPTELPQASDGRVMLVRPRLSRIYYRRRFFDYPLKLNADNARPTSGWLEAALLGASYARSRLVPRNPEATLEDFFINRFGDRLYRTFFKDYTEKVWGVPCQRDLCRVGRAAHQGPVDHERLAARVRRRWAATRDVAQKERRDQPDRALPVSALGPGQMWEEVGRAGPRRGGEIHLRHKVVGIDRAGALDSTGRRYWTSRPATTRWIDCDAFISTMPISELVEQLAAGRRGRAPRSPAACPTGTS